MTESAIVISVSNNEAKLSPIPSEACLSCSGGCDKKQTVLDAVIPENLNIKPGMLVHIKCNRAEQSKQGLLSLFVPFLLSVSGYFIAQPIMILFGKTCGDAIRAAFVLGLLIISTTTIYFFNKNKKFNKYLTITDIIQ